MASRVFSGAARRSGRGDRRDGCRQAAAEDLAPDRIGRLNLVSGAVAFQLQNQPSWSEADFNYPVYTGMRVVTDVKGRAEIGVGPDALRLASDTEVEMATMSPRLLDIVVIRGHVHLSLHQLDTRENVEIELSAGSVWPLQTGGYAAELGAEDQPSKVAVLDGKASLLGSNQELPVDAGQRAIVEGDTKVSLISSAKAAVYSPVKPPAHASAPQAPDDAKGRPDTTPSGAASPPAARPPSSGSDDVAFIQWAVDRDTLPGTNVPPNLARDSSGYQIASNRPRRMEAVRSLWPGLVSGRSAGWLGALSLRPLGVDATLGPDVDRRPALGLRAVSLRTMGDDRRAMGLGPGRPGRARGLCAGAGCLYRLTGSIPH